MRTLDACLRPLEVGSVRPTPPASGACLTLLVHVVACVSYFESVNALQIFTQLYLDGPTDGVGRMAPFQADCKLSQSTIEHCPQGPTRFRQYPTHLSVLATTAGLRHHSSTQAFHPSFRSHCSRSWVSGRVLQSIDRPACPHGSRLCRHRWILRRLVSQRSY